LPVQYADFAVWQQEYLRGDVLERQVEYWRDQLAGAATVLELPTDKPRPAKYSYRGATLKLELPQALTRSLQRFSRERGCTLFMTLLAAWQMLLHRYSKQEHFVVGANVANRNRAETEGLIGFFVNMLPLRANLAGDPTFLELLERVKKVCLGAYAHQDVPFDKLVKELQPERSLSHSPLFQVIFAFRNTLMGALNVPGLTLNIIERERDEAQFDLILDIQESEGHLSGTMRYNTDLFEAASINRIQEHFMTILENVLQQPDTPLSAIEMLTEDEKRQQSIEEKELFESNASVLRTIRRKRISVPQATL
jgi:non-ribosomal peptide synthetase component F